MMSVPLCLRPPERAAPQESMYDRGLATGQATPRRGAGSGFSTGRVVIGGLVVAGGSVLRGGASAGGDVDGVVEGGPLVVVARAAASRRACSLAAAARAAA